MIKNCDNCKDIILRDNFSSETDYINCLNYIKELVESNKFKVASQTCDINRVQNENGTWVSDTILHKIKCKKSGKVFEACCDTYHGKGSFKEK